MREGKLVARQAYGEHLADAEAERQERSEIVQAHARPIIGYRRFSEKVEEVYESIRVEGIHDFTREEVRRLL